MVGSILLSDAFGRDPGENLVCILLYNIGIAANRIFTNISTSVTSYFCYLRRFKVLKPLTQQFQPTPTIIPPPPLFTQNNAKVDG